MNTYEEKENMSKDHIYSHKYSEGGSFYSYLGGNSNYTDSEMRRNIVDKVLGPDYTAYIMFDEKAPKGQYDEMKKKYAANSDSWQVIWRSSSYQSEARLSPDKNVIKATIFSNYGIVGAIYVKNQTSLKKFSSGGPIIENYSSPLIHEGIQSVTSKFDLGGIPDSALTQAYRASGSPLYSFGSGGAVLQNRVYIDFLNKKKNYQKDRKYFDSYEDAKEWAIKTMDKFNPDMIKHEYAYGGNAGKKQKGDIGKSGTQYGYTLKEWEEGAKKQGLLVSPKEWWKSQEGKSYTDSFGRKKKIGQHSGDERQSMEMYGYLIANGIDLGSKIIPASAKKYVEENNYMKYADGGELPNHCNSEENIEKGNYEMMLSQLKETMHHSEELSKILKSEKHIEAWVVSKMEVVTQTLSDITHYLDGKTEYAQGGKIKTPGLATVKIENADVNFDRDHYKGIFEDIDLDGIPNADDPEPQKPGDTKSVEQVEFTKVFDKVIDTKKGLDKELDIFIQKLRDYAPENSAIYARTKTPYSIFNKLVDTRLLDEKKGLKDLVGTTIAFDDLEDLKKANKLAKKGFFGKVLDFDDFYENPNHGYRAYHYIIDQDGVPIELQLKTTRMKDVNILSHEPYKQKKLNETYNDYVTLLAHQADMGAPDAIVAYNNLMKDKETVSKKLFKNNPN